MVIAGLNVLLFIIFVYFCKVPNQQLFSNMFLTNLLNHITFQLHIQPYYFWILGVFFFYRQTVFLGMPITNPFPRFLLRTTCHSTVHNRMTIAPWRGKMPFKITNTWNQLITWVTLLLPRHASTLHHYTTLPIAHPQKIYYPHSNPRRVDSTHSVAGWLWEPSSLWGMPCASWWDIRCEATPTLLLTTNRLFQIK